MDYETLTLDYKSTFSLYTNLFKIIGIDFFSSGISVGSRIRFFVLNIIFVPFICGQFSLVTKISAGNFLEGAQSVPVSVMFVLDIIKMITALMKRSELQQIFLEIGELWPRELKGDEEKGIILKSWLRQMGTLINVFFAYALLNVALYEVIPFLITVYNIFNDVPDYWLPFQLPDIWTVDSKMSYLATYVWVIAATVPCQLFVYLPFDLLIIIMTSNVSILLRLLQVDLINSVDADNGDRIRRCSDDGSWAGRCSNDSYDRIAKIVMNHQKLLRISEQLRRIFGLVIFIHVAFSAVVICFFSFLTLVYGGLAKTVVNLLTVWNTVITIFLLALAGELLCDTSSGVGDAAYKSLWYTSDVRVKRLVLFIITRSQKPCYLSALGFSNMTLRSFSKIMSTAWTYFSLLVQIYDDN